MKQAAHELRIAAAKVATHLMAALSDDQLQDLERGIRGGACIVLEIGPMPEINKVRLVFVEREGTRHNIVSITQ